MQVNSTIRKQAHRDILLCQCAGLLGPQFLMNCFILNYLKKYDFQDGLIMLILTFIPNAINLFFLMPMGYLSDKKGKKKLGRIGNWLQVLGFAVFGLIYLYPGQAYILAIGAILLFSFGLTLFLSSWFALLDSLLAVEGRGHFFASLRISWQVIAFIATFLVSYILSYNSSGIVYVAIIAIITFFLAVRIWYYEKIPECSVEKEEGEKFLASIKEIFKNSSYVSFCLFIFLFMFFGASILTFLNLYEKESLLFTDSEVVVMGYSAQLGALVGYWFGARLVDRSKLVLLFRGNAFMAALIMAIAVFLVKGFPQVVLFAGILTFAFSVFFNSMGIGITTEAMSLVRSKNRSLAISLSVCMLAGGGALSSLVSSAYLESCQDFNMNLLGNTLNHYQAYLLIAAVGLSLVVLIFSLKRNRTF